MKSSYKKLGNYIQIVNERDADKTVDRLLGVSIRKVLMPSIANIIGTDMSTYKIIKKNQFAYGPVTSRNGDKISVALLEEYDEAIVSQAYTVFEVIDKNKLLPEYLMMWFRRPEFDRYARFKSHGSAREIFDWGEMCDTELPIPFIEKQREIVKEYHILVDRIDLNNKLITKLEETAQSIYKQWFVDFEFPDANGLPYKSSDGKMEFCEELEMEIPVGWKIDNLQELILFKNGKTRPNSIGNFPVYGGNGIIEFIDDYNEENIIAIGRVGAYCGSLYRVLGKCWISDNAICAKSKTYSNMFSYYLLSSLNLNERSEGTGQPLITQGLLNGIRVIVPETSIIEKFEKFAIKLFNESNLETREVGILEQLKSLLLSKMATIEIKEAII
ncbi:restriction endonuclease subunit S [Flavobacterium sp. FPG59]|uniref:restriction endonuclease subunit S n=1 Tax=Flavobacterium sp. FPG59 TaxID=1929267 RepID=UPI000A3B42B5|nr:restriction endonuclease subunit S [Flavobacterium sp. FPG59]OUD30777.1 hypothetical protein FPG59_15295 [Flavobacterium sp. FPG59]